VIWRQDRERCPQWLLPPRKVRELIDSGTKQAPWGYVKALRFLDDGARAEFVSLLLWRSSKSLQPLDAGVENEALSIVEGIPKISPRERKFILAQLLSEFRQRRDKSLFDKIVSLLENEVTADSDANADLVAQKLLWARDGLDFDGLEKDINLLVGSSPIWSILKATLNFECGNYEAAKALTFKVHDDLADRARRDRQSSSVASRFAWASALLRAQILSETWLPRQRDRDDGLTNGYDTDEEVESLSLQIRANRLRRNEELIGFQPAFGAGRYKDHSRTIRFRNSPAGYEAETVFRLADAVYLPLRLSHVDIFGTCACYALDSEPLLTLAWYLRLVRSIPSTSSPFLNKYFGSISIAKLDTEIATELFESVLLAVNFWHNKSNLPNSFSSNTIARLQTLIEILARLVVRQDAERAIKVFRFAGKLFGNPNAVHHELYEPTGHLFEWSLAALPREDRAKLSIDCVEFPLPSDQSAVPFRWPDPTVFLFSRRVHPRRPSGDSRWRAAVAKLLAASRSAEKGRSMAIHRLAYLYTFSCLDEDEKNDFKMALWSAPDAELTQLPADVDLFPHVIATLPAPDEVDPFRITYSYLFEAPFDPKTTDRRLRNIVAAARGGNPIPSILPERQQALWLLDELASLAPQGGQLVDPMGFIEDLLHVIGEVISYAILPQLVEGDLDDSRISFVLRFGRLERGSDAFAGWHEFARLVPGQLAKIGDDLRRAIWRGTLFDTSAAAYAIGTWATESDGGRYPPIPDSLKEALLASLDGRTHESLQPRLWATRRLFKSGELSEQQIKRLTESIRDLSFDLSYEGMPNEGSAAVGVTAARAEFVRLVQDLLDSGHPSPTNAVWVLGSADDPLPEVRFATDDME
jgi:hypothetical protein